ncbi:MAG: hypothetical protein MUE44_17080 [Oscillatoriaceae cyanobacterium Prado104]|jgi:hypothetical protein|nr:hypothetical protein [Oscillatoriaceae cyanobacterium Prado104]
MKSTLHLTTKVLDGNRIEIESPNLLVGQTVEVVVFINDGSADLLPDDRELSLEQRLAFLKLPLEQRRLIMASQAEAMLAHYQENTEWQELMAGDIIDD